MCHQIETFNDMATSKYDKSKVMKRAWYIFNHSFMSFSDALRESWKRIKEEAKVEEKVAEFKKKNAAYNYRLNRAYYGCRFGHDDWVRDFQNDAKVAIKRAVNLSRLQRISITNKTK